MGINNSLLKSIQTIVNKAINIAPFDKTRQAQIITNNGDGTYTIRLDGILYNNIPSYPIFNGLIVGTIVKVVIPSNQTSQMYVQPSKGGGGGEHKELTQAEYDALSPSEKHNDTVYFITDSAPNTVVINDSVPIGAIQAYGAQVAPYGWHICDGSAVRRDAYPELFAVIGTTYGEGDGSTTFNLPDLRGKVSIGSNTTYTIGSTGGEATHILTIDEMPAHAHPSFQDYDMSNPATPVTGGYLIPHWVTAKGSKGRLLSNYTSPYRNEGGSQSHNNMQPYLVTNYIIKVKEPAIVTASTAPSVHDFIDVFYPVGSYYESSDASFDPNADWGGTWNLQSINNSDKFETLSYTTSSGVTLGTGNSCYRQGNIVFFFFNFTDTRTATSGAVIYSGLPTLSGSQVNVGVASASASGNSRLLLRNNGELYWDGTSQVSVWQNGSISYITDDFDSEKIYRWYRIA